MELSNLNIKNGLCISLGANIDSKFGSPLESLLICKPKIEEIINEWGNHSNKKKEDKDTSNGVPETILEIRMFIHVLIFDYLMIFL